MTSDVATDQPTERTRTATDHPRTVSGTTSDTGVTWVRALARFGWRPGAVVGLRERLVPRFTDSSPYTGGGWLPCILVALAAGFLRFWHLSWPNGVIFDETYYAKDAWSLLHHGYEGTWSDNADSQIIQHHGYVDGLLSTNGSYIVHPPIGKWIISIGENFFHLTPFGWRFSVALLGTLSVLMLCRIGRRLFRSTLMGCIAGLLLTLDGMHFVMSRTSLLDMVLMFWVLAAFGCLLIDRDDTRLLVANRLRDGVDPQAATVMKLGLRPWRLLAGICLGLAVGTKWSGMYVIAAFGLLSVLWDLGTRRAAGAARPYRAVLRRDAWWAFAALVLVPLVIYVWSWSGWFMTHGGYFREWARHRSGLSPATLDLKVVSLDLPRFDMSWVPDPLRSLWHYHAEMWRFHNGLTSPHPYQSNAWSWLVLGRPVAYYYKSIPAGESGCNASECAQEVLGIGTPLLWWAGCVAVLYLVFRWAARRDWRAGAILCGLIAGWGPWFLYQQRTIFLFYAVIFTPFLALAVTMMLGALMGGPTSSHRRRTWGTAATVAIIAAIAWNFLYFYPILTGQTIPMDAWRSRMWFSSWI